MIYLDTTQNEHQLLIDAIEKAYMPPWIKKSLIGRIQFDIDTMNARTTCEHSFSKYIGERECCTKCGGYDINHGETWMLADSMKE